MFPFPLTWTLDTPGFGLHIGVVKGAGAVASGSYVRVRATDSEGSDLSSREGAVSGRIYDTYRVRAYEERRGVSVCF